ncbi:MAG: hypothetical protein IPP64_06050 [Bacteroidetes bacterium]|nr:hypothetical protein [Bacteroidota bacterium]
MKRILVVAFLFFSVNTIFAQDFMDKIVKKTCECLDNISDTLPEDRFNMELGLCMLDAANPYKKQIKKEYGIDLENIDTEGERLGRIIGLKMAGACPNSLVKITNRVKVDEPPPVDELSVVGTVTKIEDDLFVVISLKDELGKITKYYWLGFIETANDLTGSYSSLQGKSIRITYINQEYFEPKLKEYRQFPVIKKITIY